MKKFLTIVGNRPQLIKLDRKLKQVLVYTGQHYSETLKDVFFKGLKLPKPDYDLGETDLGKMVDKLIPIVRKEKPDYIIVYGDTRSTLAGCMVAIHEGIKLIHIEAGCRCGDDTMIEERIRTIVDDYATIHFAPSESCAERLNRNLKNTYVYNVGSTQIDTMWESVFPTKRPKDAYKYSICTIHRDFNLNWHNLSSIFEAFQESNKKIELYAHPNLENVLDKMNIILPKNVKLKKPLPYKKMINRVAFANKVITDSGGLQVEAFYLRRPCITLRYNTEWQETVDSGWNKLCGPNKEEILKAINTTFVGRELNTIYGTGQAKLKIRTILQSL